jgi:hypothetical protein
LFPTCGTLQLFFFQNFSWNWREEDLMTIMIQKKLQATLAEFNIQDFCTCFQQWCEHSACCIKSQGNYFRRDSMK